MRINIRYIKNFQVMMKPLLVAFDFDHTIVDDNTDLTVQKLISSDKIPDDIKKLHYKDGWTTYMQEIFYLLHRNNVTPLQIQNTIVNIPPTSGMDELLQFLQQRNAEVIIVSDANSVFINDWLSHFSLVNAVAKVFTNPARFDEEGCLKIEMYHLQDWCQLSTKNLCKGQILESYIKEREAEGVTFSKVAYVGDGRNDLCPCLRLSEKDLAFPREGFQLDKLIAEMQMQEDVQLKAKVNTWKTGNDIIKIIGDHLGWNLN